MRRGKKLHYGVWVVATYCLVLPTIFLFSNPIGLYMVPICNELGISQGVYSLSRTFVSFLCAASYLLYVPMQKKFSVRGLVCMGLLSGALSALFFSVSENFTMIMVAATFDAFITPLASQISMGNIVNAWFAKRNATVMSIIFASGNLGGFINAKLIAFWIHNSGWRMSMRYTMFILLAVMVLTFLVIRDNPREKGLLPWGTQREGQPALKEPEILPGAAYKEFRRHKKFYCLMAWAFFTGIITYPVINIVPALLSSLGYDTIFSGTAVSLLSIGSLILLPFLGLSVDKWGVRPAGIFCAGFYLISIAGFMLLTPGKPFLVLFASLSLGIANILFPMLPMFIKELFGFREYSQYMSQANIVRMLGTALGYPLLGFAFDMFQSYNMVFVLFGCFSIAMLAVGVIATDKREPLWVETRPGYSGYCEKETHEQEKKEMVV